MQVVQKLRWISCLEGDILSPSSSLPSLSKSPTFASLQNSLIYLLRFIGQCIIITGKALSQPFDL